MSGLSLWADIQHRGRDKGVGNGGQNPSLVANEFLIRATNGAASSSRLDLAQSTRDWRPVTYYTVTMLAGNFVDCSKHGQSCLCVILLKYCSRYLTYTRATGGEADGSTETNSRSLSRTLEHRTGVRVRGKMTFFSPYAT